MTEPLNEVAPVGSYERARNLLLEHIDEETFYDLIHGHEICVEGKQDNYVLKQVNDTKVSVSKIGSVEEYLSTRDKVKDGKIEARTPTKLYDNVVSFIVNAKHRKIDWNCGIFKPKLPKKILSVPHVKTKKELTRDEIIRRRLKPRFHANKYNMKRLIESQLTPPYTTRLYEDGDGFFNPVFFIETRNLWILRKKHARINLNIFNINAISFTDEGYHLCNRILPHIRENTDFRVDGIQRMEVR